ncbi:MAG: acetate--CoA ligase family protein [Acidimicrobiia bacterium]|nr:acetate--CoA ligase family protein [Acidimicrobiia bacterium]
MSGPESATALPPTTTTLSEAASKALLAPHSVPFAPERLATTPAEAVAAAQELGFPVAAKLCGAAIAHKTERGLVRLGLADAEAVERAATELLAAGRPEDEVEGVLVAPMLAANRELICGVATDEQFGQTVVVGVGGILAEAVADVAIRLVPIDRIDAAEMLEDLATQSLLGPFRGEPAVDRDAVVELLVGLSEAAQAIDGLVSVDCNPVMIVDGRPVAVDALVEVRS